MKEQMEAALDFMTTLREQVIPAEIGAEPKLTAAERQKKVAEYAAQHQLQYVLTPPLSAQELHDSAEKYPIGAAAQPVEDQFQQRAPTQVIQQLFMSSPELLFDPNRAEDGESHRFAFWKVEDIADHVPTLKEAGVRDQAVRDWKTAEFAQKKAKERADELADLVRKSKQSMPEALAGQKVTKSDKGPAIVVIPTPPFSWFTVQSAAPRDMMPDPTPRLSDIAGVTDPDEAFMKAVFDEMRVGDVRRRAQSWADGPLRRQGEDASPLRRRRERGVPRPFLEGADLRQRVYVRRPHNLRLPQHAGPAAARPGLDGAALREIPRPPQCGGRETTEPPPRRLTGLNSQAPVERIR